VDCIITNNILYDIAGDGVEFAFCPQNNCEISYNCVVANLESFDNIEPGPGNILEDPLFQAQGGIPDAYFLAEGSPCIETGNPNMFPDPDGSASDMGAFPTAGLPALVSVGWAQGLYNAHVEIPVSISRISGREFFQSQAVIEFPGADLVVDSVFMSDGSPPQQAGWNLMSQSDPGELLVTQSGAAELPADGELFRIAATVTALLEPGENIPVNIVFAALNNEAHYPETANGGVHFPEDFFFGDVNLNSMIDLGDADLLFEFIEGDAELNQLQFWYADVTLSINITAFDGALIVQYLEDVIEDFPANGEQVDTYADGVVDLQSRHLPPGAHVRYPLTILNAINVSAFQADVDVIGANVELVNVANPPDGVWFSRVRGAYPSYTVYLGGEGHFNGQAELCELDLMIPHAAVGDSFRIVVSSVLLNETPITETSTATIVVDSALAASDPRAPAIDEFALLPPYPNPFNPATTLRYSLAQPGHAALTIFNTNGREVARLVDRRLPAGSYELSWDAAHLPSGMYVAVFESGANRAMQKLMLIK
jgi:hypothetical protein